ncbi:GNAT family N-acetyltransferase [Streptomyces sp. NPDC054796]
MRIRPGRDGDFEALREIERAAGLAFGDLGMHAVAEDEPPPLAVLRDYARAGSLWVAEDGEGPGPRWGPGGGDGPPVAYVMVEPVDGNVHIEQISVHPASAHRRIGRALIEHVASLATADDVPALTLTTFSDVPWNAPYYERCGFRRLPESELTPGLRRIRAHEAGAGLDRWPRVCMRRELGARQG